MKKYLIMLMVLFMLIIGCVEYEDGKAFFKVTASDPIDPAYTYFSFLPETAALNKYYEVKPGTYEVYFSTIEDEMFYRAEIDIFINEAEDDSDGEDVYFTFHIYSSGDYDYSYKAPSYNSSAKTLPEGYTFENNQKTIKPSGELIDSYSYEQANGKYKMSVSVEVYKK